MRASKTPSQTPWQATVPPIQPWAMWLPFHGPEAEVNVCAGDLACIGQRCVATPAAGQPCPNHACASGLYCSVAGSCEPLVPAGASCAVAPCQAGLDCNATMKCVAPAPMPWILSIGFWGTSYACD
jgi:hypothetical protein